MTLLDLMDAPPKLSLADKLAAYFKSRPGQWIDGKQLATVAGGYAWRSRCADIRKAPYSMQIDNRQFKRNGYKVSEYKFVPQEAQP